MTVIVATGIAADGSRAILGLDDSEDETFWRGLLTALKQRGRGVGTAGHQRPACRAGQGGP